jgi:hypothetical protein
MRRIALVETIFPLLSSRNQQVMVTRRIAMVEPTFPLLSSRKLTGNGDEENGDDRNKFSVAQQQKTNR